MRASGRGLQPTGVRIKDVADFKIYTEGAGEGQPDVQIIGPGGAKIPCKIQKIDGTTYSATYYPEKEGRYRIMVTFAGQEIHKSPFEIGVGPFKDTQIRAYGPGLVGGVVGYAAVFTVDTNGETGALGFSIQGPSQAQIKCDDNGDCSADVRYYPTAPGEYAVHILCDSEDIPKSPYIAQILPNTDYYPDKVRVYGQGVEPDSVTADAPTKFTIETKDAGSAPLDVRVSDGNCNSIDVKLVQLAEGVYEATYVPNSEGKHTVQVNYGGVATPNSPYRVHVTYPYKTLNLYNVECYGPGLEDPKANVQTYFTVDTRYVYIYLHISSCFNI